MRPVVLSDRAVRQLARIKAARGRLSQANGKEPSVGELADETGLSRDHIDHLVAPALGQCAVRRGLAWAEQAAETDAAARACRSRWRHSRHRLQAPADSVRRVRADTPARTGPDGPGVDAAAGRHGSVTYRRSL
jgi:hypothetical protein